MFPSAKYVLLLGWIVGIPAWSAEQETAQARAARLRTVMQASLERQHRSTERQMAPVRTQPHRPSLPVAPVPSSTVAVPLSWFEWQPDRDAVTRPFAPIEQPAASYTEPPCEPLPADTMNELIRSASVTYDVATQLVREVARQESGFRPCSVSRTGAEGLMQLMPETQLMLEVDDPFDPEQNVMAGTRLLRNLLDRYDGNLALALSAYNAGPTIVDRVMRVPQIAETRDYVSKILGRLAVGGE